MSYKIPRSGVANTLAVAIKSALCLSMIPAISVAQTSGEDEVLETVTVTGSRIPRLDPQLVTPVQIYDAEFIANSGAGNLQDFLFTASFAGPGLFNENATLSQTAGTANFDSRGFGDDYVVILLNGRRLPGDPLGGDGATNVNLIPISAVQRVEYLSTGASAIYGADAVQGVLNIITKQDFQGLNANIRYDASVDGDGPRMGIGITGGITSEKGFATVTVDFQQQEDLNGAGLPLFGNSVAPDGTDARSPVGLPETYVDFAGGVSTPAADCPTSDIRVPTFTAAGMECAFDPANQYDAIPRTDRFNFLTNAEYRLSNILLAYGEFRFSRILTEVRNGAAPAVFAITGASWLPELDAALGTDLTNSAAAYVLRRLTDAGPRASDNTNTAFSSVIGARIEIAEGHELDISLQNVESEMNRVGVGGQVSTSAMTAAVASGLFDPRVVYNPAFFAANNLTVTTQRQAVGTENTLRAEFAGEIGSTDIGYAFGASYKDDSFNDRADANSSSGDIAGGASSNGAGQRDSTSFYTEFAYSPIDSLELSLAARYDDYSWEGAGASSGDDATTYMVGASFRPIDNLLVRGSIGTGFKAPVMGELFLGRSFGSTTAVDTTTCNTVTANPASTPMDIATACRRLQVNSVSGGNPLLKTESSDNWSVGVVYEPTENWSLALDYYNIKVEDKIGSLSVQEILNNETLFPQLITRVGGSLTAPGAQVRSNLQNLTTEEGSGIDLSTRAQWELGRGAIIADVRVAYLIEHNRQASVLQPLCDDAGTTSEPEWRLNGQLGWQEEKWDAVLTVRYLGESQDLPGGRDTANQTCAPNPALGTNPIDDYLELGLRGSYRLSERAELAVGIVNLTDEDPSFSVVAGTAGWPWYDQALFDPRGTRFYMNLNYEFF